MRVEKRTIDFQNYFKQIPVSFKVYANFECNLENAADKLIKAILKEYKYCKKIKNKHFRNI